MNRSGKWGKINAAARKRIAEIAEEENISTCEIRFDGCEGTFGIAPAHRYPRDWYKRKENYDTDPTPEDFIKKLSDKDQWLAGCQRCHARLDSRNKTTEEEKEEIFIRERGE
jgi:hypothetical protein